MRSDPDAGSVIPHAACVTVWAERAGLFGLMDSAAWSGDDSQAVGTRAELADPIRKPLQVILIGGLPLIYDVPPSVSPTSPVRLRSGAARL